MNAHRWNLHIMEYRAPRFDQIEIPLTVFDEQGGALLCSCINISETGALLRLQQSAALTVGQILTARLVQRGLLADVAMRIERLEGDAVGVRFLRQV